MARSTCARPVTLRYLYDFGDGWEHTIKIERLLDPVPDIAYPRLIEAAGRCPPEHIGGPWVYAEFLEAIADPKHERHAELSEWIGDDFDPNAFDADEPAEPLYPSGEGRLAELNGGGKS